MPTVFQKWPKTPFLGDSTPIFSKTIHDEKLLSPDSRSACENQSKTLIVTSH